MIRSDKQKGALRALQCILVRARTMAYESKHTDLALLLDNAEILPDFIADEQDRTDEFRIALLDIAQMCQQCSHAVNIFDEDDGS